MPSARTGPDQKHALEALWRKWVFPFFGSTGWLRYVRVALPKFVGGFA
jgi:hypothetical protein